MRNYELINEIYELCLNGSGPAGPFANQYLNDMIAIQKLIESERPEMKESHLEETRFE